MKPTWLPQVYICLSGSHFVNLLQDGIRRVCEAGVAACKADPALQTTMQQAVDSMQAAVAKLRLQADSVSPGWALLGGGNHGINGLLIAPLDHPQTDMLYCFVQSKTSGHDDTVSLADILCEMRVNFEKNGIPLPALDDDVPGDGSTSHDADNIQHLHEILLQNS